MFGDMHVMICASMSLIVLSMKTVKQPKSEQSTNDGEHVEYSPLTTRQLIQEWVWEFLVDRSGVLDPERVDHSERDSEHRSANGRCWRSELFLEHKEICW